MSPLPKSNDRQQLEAAYQAARDKRTANRINILLLLDDGYIDEEVPAILRLDDRTIHRQEKSYRALGLAETIKNPLAGGTCKLSLEHLKELEAYFEQNLCETTAQIVVRVSNTYGVTYSTAGYFKQLQLVYLAPYAPNLNLIERLWKFMKNKTLSSRYYLNFKKFNTA